LNHKERRDRKLLLTKKEIKDIIKLTRDNGVTTIPLEVFTLHGRFKIKIGELK
jgi:tmRNA-binding protein